MIADIQELDILNLRTTNINVRISPILKIKIIEHGAKMGINLSDFINYVLTKTMSGQMEVEETPQYKELAELYQDIETANNVLEKRNEALQKQNAMLQAQQRATQAELSKYEAVAEPYRGSLGQDITIRGETYQPKHLAELVGILLKMIQVKN